MESENSSICICCLKLSMFSNFMSLLYFLIFSLSCRDMSLYSDMWTLFIYYENQPLFWDVISQVLFPPDTLTVYKYTNFCMAKAP